MKRSLKNIQTKDVIKISLYIAISALLIISPLVIAPSNSDTDSNYTTFEKICFTLKANETKIITLAQKPIDIAITHNIFSQETKTKPNNKLYVNDKNINIDYSQIVYEKPYEYEIYKKGDKYDLRFYVPRDYYANGKRITTEQMTFTVYYDPQKEGYYPLHDTQNPDYDYIIISNETFFPVLRDNFVSWKIANDDKVSSIWLVNVTDITNNGYTVNDTFGDATNDSGGNPFIPDGKEVTSNYDLFNDTQAQIRNFLRECNYTHNAKYVLLAGDKDVVPVRMACSRASGDSCSSFDNDVSHASDLYYACLDYNMNNNTNSYWMENPCCNAYPWDEVDYGIDLHVGRALVSTTQHLHNWINKTKAYVEGTSNAYKWNIVACKSVTSSISNQSWTGWYDGEFTGIALSDEFPSNLSFVNNQNISQDQWIIMDDYANGMIDNIAGINLIYHTGHGGTLYSTNGGCYQPNNCNNTEHPNFVYTEGCHSGKFGETTSSRSQNWIKEDDCCFALISNSAYGWFVASTFFGEDMMSAMFNTTRGLNEPTFCVAHDIARENQGSVTADGVWAMIFKETNFIGDPALDYQWYTGWRKQDDMVVSVNSTEGIEEYNATLHGYLDDAVGGENTSCGFWIGASSVNSSNFMYNITMYNDTSTAVWTNMGKLNASEDSYILKSTYCNNSTVMLINDQSHVWKSTDYGYTFTDIYNATFPIENRYVSCIEYIGNNIVLTAGQHKIFRSTDLGTTWTNESYDLDWVMDIATNGSGGCGQANHYHKNYRSDDYGETWTFLNYLDVPEFTVMFSIEYCDNNIWLTGGANSLIHRSTNNGINYTENTTLDGNVNCIEYFGDGVVVAGTSVGSLYLSEDYGETWTDLGDYSPGSIYQIESYNNYIGLAGATGGHLLYSNNKGRTWTDLGNKFSFKNPKTITATDGSVFLVGTSTEGYYWITNRTVYYDTSDDFSEDIGCFEPGTYYTIKSWCKNSNGFANSTSEDEILTKPLSPTNVNTFAGSKAINVSWTKGIGANNTYIERNTSASWSFGSGTTVYNGTNSYYVDTSLDNENTYYYQLWSYSEYDNLYQYSDDNESCYNTTLDEAPQFIDIKNQDNNTFIYTSPITFNWSKAENCSMYNLRISNNSLFTDIYRNITDINIFNYPLYCLDDNVKISFTLPPEYSLHKYEKYYVEVRALIKYEQEGPL